MNKRLDDTPAVDTEMQRLADMSSHLCTRAEGLINKILREQDGTRRAMEAQIIREREANAPTQSKADILKAISIITEHPPKARKITL